MATCKHVMSIIMIITCVILFLMSGWYWWYLYLATQNSDATAIALYVISGVLLIVMAIVGIISTIRSFENLMCYFAIVMFVMFIFAVIQVAVTIWASQTCDGAGNNENNPFSFICKLQDNTSAIQYWIPTGCIILVTLLGFIFAIILRSIWRKDGDKEVYY